MNLLQDGTAWILPSRCASRYTAGLLWKYGLTKFSGHGMDLDVEHKQIVMNVRNPVNRFVSFYRMVRNRTTKYELTLDDYFWNLIENVLPLQFTNDVPDVIDDPMVRYPVPLVRYLDTMLPKYPDHIVHVESIEEDLDAAGYPVLDYTDDRSYEPDGISASDVMQDKRYMEILHQFYDRDYTSFGYRDPYLTVQ
jgi:hypothetical protein